MALWGRVGVVTPETFLEHVCQVVGRPSPTLEVPSTTEETGYSLWVLPRLLAVVQEAGVSLSRDVVALVNMLAVEAASIQTGNVKMAVGVSHGGGGL